jgi:hypothetical protein
MASGAHYPSPRELPVVCGVDGVGVLDDGTRVFFGGPRRPYGAMAERKLWHARVVGRCRRASRTSLRPPFPTRLYRVGFR